MQRVRAAHGERGAAWFARLPELVAECERRWSLSVGEAFSGLSYNWVAPAVMGERESVVLKLGVPCAELSSEIDALRAWDGRGAAQLLHADASLGALVLERLEPGTLLAEFWPDRDVEATEIAVSLMRQLHAVTPTPSTTLAHWTSGLERARAAGFESELVDRALALRGELLATSLEPVLLHADLHHFNVLSAERQSWLAIDPKGVIGEPAYDAAPFLINPIGGVMLAPDPRAILERRLERFAGSFDRRRVTAWAFVHGAMSAWWSHEENASGHEPALAFARLVGSLGAL